MKTPPCPSILQVLHQFGRSRRSRLTAKIMLLASTVSFAAPTWNGGGDNLFWSNPLNWNTSVLPAPADSPVFGTSLPLNRVVHLDGDRAVNNLTFNANNFILGAYGNSSLLNLSGGTVSTTAGNFATINSILTGTNYTFNGGGTTFLNSLTNLFTGNVTVDGAGTRLLLLANGPQTAYNNHDNIGRSDQTSLGLSAPARTIFLTGGAEMKLIGGSWNPDGGPKIISIGAGGGGINIASARQAMTLDDASQFIGPAGAGAFTKSGNGVLRFLSNDFNVPVSQVNVDGGWLEFRRQSGGTAGARFSAFGTAANTTPYVVNNGGRVNLNGDGVLDQNLTLNPGGALFGSGGDRNFGVGTGGQTFTLNGGAIAGFDGFGPGTARNIRVNGALTGSGTVDILGSTQVPGAFPRAGGVVFQRADAASNFSGTLVIHGQGALELNPRGTASISGLTDSTIGNNNGTIELRGFNSTLDVRDSFATDNSNLGGHSTVDVRLTSPDAGAVHHIDTGRSDAATGVGQVFQFDRLEVDNNRLFHRNNNNYGLRFGGMNFAGTAGSPATFTYESNNNAKMEVNGTVNETVSGDSLVRIGNTTNNNNNAGGLRFGAAVNLSSVTISSGELHLFGGNGTLNFGSISTTGSLLINGGSGNNTSAGTLVLNNNAGNTGTGGIPAGPNANRIAGNLPVTMQSNSSIRLIGENNATGAETIENISIPSGQARFDIQKNGTATAPVALTLGTAGTGPVIGGTAGMLYAGTIDGAAGTQTSSLGTGAPNSTAVLIPNYVASPFMGAQHTTQSVINQSATVSTGSYEWAKYNVANGVQPFVAADYDLTNTFAGPHVKLNGLTAITLPGATTVNTLNLQFYNATANNNGTHRLLLNGNQLTLSDGGLAATSTQNTHIFDTGAGGITSSAASRQLIVSNISTLDVGASINDNGATPVTLVKNGTGNMRLTNATHTVAASPSNVAYTNITANQAGDHTNGFTGGLVINNGNVDVWRAAYLNGNAVTMNGGSINLNHPTAGTNRNTNATIAFGNNFTVNGNSLIGWDNNGEVGDGAAGNNNLFDMGSLTVNGTNTWVGVGGFNGGDVRFNGVTLNGNPSFNLGQARGGETAAIFNGVTSGTGFSLEGTGNAAGSIVLGGGASDNVSNTYAGTVSLNLTNGDTRPKLRLDKASGTDAITGDIIINGGALFWGGIASAYNGADAFGDRGQWNGNSALDGPLAASGRNQIADTANITMYAGDLGENSRYNTDKWGSLTHKNGTVNVGYGTMDVDTYTMSGGALNWGAQGGSGGIFRSGSASVENVTQINIQNNFPTTVSRWEVGPGGINLKGTTINVGETDGNDYRRFSAGAVLELGGDLTYTVDTLNTHGGARGIVVGPNREQAMNFLDLANGTRTFDIAEGADFVIAPSIRSGGIIKTGAGQLSIRNYIDNSYTGGVTVNEGALIAGSPTALGSGAVAVAAGGTLKTDGSAAFSNNMVLAGAGSLISDGDGVRELGALVNNYGRLTLSGTVSIFGGATIGTHAQQGSAGVSGSEVGIGNADANNVDILSRGLTEITNAGGITGNGTLTLTGAGNGIVTGGIKTTGGLIKQGGGTWTIGAGVYPGATEVQAGVLRATAGTSLGNTLPGTTVYGGATLLLDGGFTTGERLTLHGTGVFGVRGALESTGNNTVTGNINTVTGTSIRSNTGTLALRGTLATAGALTLTGAGNGNLNRPFSGGVGAGDALIVNGPGTWSLTGANSFTGGTRINGGSLESTGLHAASALTLAGGSYRALAAHTVNGLNVTAGGGTVNGSANLTVGAIIRTAGATANFAGTVNTSTGNTASGILGGWATYGDNWAVAGSPISGLASYTPVTSATGTIGAGNHGRLEYDAYGYANASHTVAMSGATFKIAAGLQGLATGANTITVSEGGLLKEGAATFNLGGTGLLSGTTAADELNLHINGGAAFISNPLIGAGAGALNKAGAGEARLFGSSAFTGPINVNGGTLSIIGGGGTHPAALGAQTGARNITLNGGGTFSVYRGDYDLNVSAGQQMQVVLGTGGGTLHTGNGNMLFNDVGQISGGGPLTISGGGFVSISNAYNLAGDVTVAGGALRLGHASALSINPEQRLTLKNGTGLVVENGGNAVIRQALTLEGGNTIRMQAGGGNREFSGVTSFSGTNRLVPSDFNDFAARNMVFSGPVTGSGTLQVLSPGGGLVNFAGIGDFSGDVSMGANARVDFRQPGALGGTAAAPLSVTGNGTNAFLVLRNFQTNNYAMDVTANRDMRIDVNTVGIQHNNNHLTGIRNLTLTGDRQLSVEGANGYWLNVKGSATAGGDLRKVGGQHIRLENGISGVRNLNLELGFIKVMAPTTTTGATVVNGGSLELAAAGTLTSPRIDLRSGEIVINGGEGLNANRIAGVPINLGGGTFETNEATNLGTVTLNPGTTRINYSNPALAVSTPLVLTGFTRQNGSVMTLGSRQGVIGSTFTSYGNTLNGNAMPGTSGADTRWAGPKIHIPGQADIYGNGTIGSVDIIPWAVYDNEFVSYRAPGGTMPGTEFGVDLGMVRLDNNLFPTQADTGNLTGNITHLTRFINATTNTQTGNFAARGIKMDGGTGRTLDLAGFSATVDRGLIIQVANDQSILGGGNDLTAVTSTGTGSITAGTAGAQQLTMHVNAGTLRVGALINDNAGGGAVSLVKSGAGTVSLRNIGPTNSNYSGGTYVNQGTLVAYRAGNLGAASGGIFMNGGSLELNIPVPGTGVDLNADINLGHNVTVNANSFIGADNNGELAAAATSLENNLVLGSMTFNGPHTLGIGGFDSYDFRFNGATMFSTSDVSRSSLTLTARTGGGASTVELGGVIAGGGFDVNSSGTVTDAAVLQIGGSSGTDNTLNTYSGLVRVTGGHVLLNKLADNNTAITGNLDIRGGVVRLDQNNQIADTSNLTLNSGGFNLNGRTETIASVEQNGGLLVTGAGVLNITGNATLNGNSNPNVFGINSADGFQVNSNGTVNVGGVLTMTDLSRAVLGASGANLNVGGLDLTGSLINQNSGGGFNTIRLNGDVTATSSSIFPARLGNSTDSDTFLDLNAIRTFNVADGPQGDDLQVSTVVRNGTGAGGILKDGTGVMVMQGGGTANSYTGLTTVHAGELHLNKNAGVNAVPGNLRIGDSANPAIVRVRNSNQIVDTSDVIIDAAGVFDLQSFNASESVGHLTSFAGGLTTLGPTSALTVNITNTATPTTYAGSIVGGGVNNGAVVKNGAGIWSLTGNSEYSGDTVVVGGTLEVDGFINGSRIVVNSGATLRGFGTVSDVVVNSGGNFSPGHSPGVLTTRSVTTSAGSATNIEIGGINPGNGASNHDQVISRGSISLAGNLLVSLVSAYIPNQFDKFLIWTNDLTDAVGGTFAGMPEGFGDTATFPVNETVDPLDYWQISYIESAMTGSDGNDISLTYIPEPGSATLAAAAGVLALSRRRRKVAGA